MSELPIKFALNKAKLNYTETDKRKEKKFTFRKLDEIESFESITIESKNYSNLLNNRTTYDVIMQSFNHGAEPLKWEHNEKISSMVLMPRVIYTKDIQLEASANFKLQSGLYTLAAFFDEDYYTDDDKDPVSLQEILEYLDSHTNGTVDVDTLFRKRFYEDSEFEHRLTGRQLYGVAVEGSILLLGLKSSTIIDQVVDTYKNYDLGVVGKKYNSLQLVNVQKILNNSSINI